MALPLLAAGLMGTLVYTRGRDEEYAGLTPGLSPVSGADGQVVKGRGGPVAVQFTPPQGVQPGLVGTVIDEEANTIDVSATLIDLAARGHLTIAEEEGGFLRGKDWRLTRTTPTAEQARTALLPYEEALLAGVFATEPTRTLSSMKNTFKPTLQRVQGLMYDEVVRRGWFRRSPAAQRGTWTGLGGLMVVGSGLAFGFLSGPLFSLGAGTGLPFPPAAILLGGAVVAGFIVVFLGRRMAARTAEGSAVKAQSEGFKKYLVTAEANQITWEEAQDIFSRYLPYAIVYGVASQWARHVPPGRGVGGCGRSHPHAAALVHRERRVRLRRHRPRHGLVRHDGGRHLHQHAGQLGRFRLLRGRWLLRWRWRRELGRLLVVRSVRSVRRRPSARLGP